VALRARQSVAGLAALGTVLRTRAAVAGVEHVVVLARLADHDAAVIRVHAVSTVERTLCTRHTCAHNAGACIE